jgi:hypothetical protein
MAGILNRFSGLAFIMERVTDERKVRPPVRRIPILFTLLAVSALLVAACGVRSESASSGHGENPESKPEKPDRYHRR